MRPRAMNPGMRWGAAWAAIAACLTLPLMGLGSAVPAQAANWVEVGVATNGTRALVDTDSIRSHDGDVEVQQRFVLSPRTPGRLGRVDQQVIYRCSSGVVETLNSTEFDRAGRVLLRSSAVENAPFKILNETLPRYILDALC
jgi:hypothetical protein